MGRCLDKAAIVDKAVLGPPVTDVEEVKMLVKLLPIWSTCLLFWTVYSQMTTFSVQQASRMDRHIGGGFVVPAGSLSAVLFLTILLFTSLNERLLFPLARRVTWRREGLTSVPRVAAGLLLSTLAMVTAALVERKRRNTSSAGASPISAFWLVPQFFLVGAGEAFPYVGQLEFFIREAPERMKSMSTGLFLATVAMGFYLSARSCRPSAPPRGRVVRDNMDEGRLDLFYWMLAVLGVVNFVVFLMFSSRHQYKGTATASTAAAGLNTEGPTVELDAMKVAVAVKMMDV